MHIVFSKMAPWYDMTGSERLSWCRISLQMMGNHLLLSTATFGLVFLIPHAVLTSAALAGVTESEAACGMHG